MMTDTSSPVNGGFGLGEPFDRRTALLLKFDDAKKAEMAAQVDCNLNAIWQAGWAVTDALGDLERHERDTAGAILMGLRFAVKHYPASVSNLLSEVPIIAEHADAIAEQADAIAALEDRVAQIADAVAALEVRKGVSA